MDEWLLWHDLSTVLVNVENLKTRPAPDCRDHPPWVPVPTAVAAEILGVHVKTLLKWNRCGVGPEPEPRDRYTHNVLLWKPAVLVGWWEGQVGLQPRSEQEICDEWLRTRPADFELKLDGPPQALGKHRKRRRRDQRRLVRRGKS